MSLITHEDKLSWDIINLYVLTLFYERFNKNLKVIPFGMDNTDFV